jgi:hypothetical protein
VLLHELVEAGLEDGAMAVEEGFEFFGVFSTPRTVWPMLARQVPVTRPTYPQPITVTSIAISC